MVHSVFSWVVILCLIFFYTKTLKKPKNFFKKA